MKNLYLKQSRAASYGRSSAGYLKKCCFCDNTIYMLADYTGKWRPYESWVAGNVNEGEWILHNCNKPHTTKEILVAEEVPAYKNHYCPKCFILLPTSTNICPYCD